MRALVAQSGGRVTHFRGVPAFGALEGHRGIGDASLELDLDGRESLAILMGLLEHGQRLPQLLLDHIGRRGEMSERI